MQIEVKVTKITTKKTIRYHRVKIDNLRRYSLHREKICGRANAFAGAVRSLALKVNRSSNSVRLLCYKVWIIDRTRRNSTKADQKSEEEVENDWREEWFQYKAVNWIKKLIANAFSRKITHI
jgi:hypothetical protein